MVFTERLNRAIATAATAHAEHRRKGSGLPYIAHPFATMLIASEVTSDEDTLIACLFHDILEDVPEHYPAERMEAEFGRNVLAVVKDVTKDGSLPAWQDRQDAYLAHLRTAREEAVIVSGADKTHNLMCILEDYNEHGEALWGRFNAGKESQHWWYGAVLDVLVERLPDSPLTANLSNIYARFPE